MRELTSLEVANVSGAVISQTSLNVAAYLDYMNICLSMGYPFMSYDDWLCY